jgi:hypothetical protein
MTRLTPVRPVSDRVQAVSRFNLQLRSLCRRGATVSRTASIPTSHGPAPVVAFAIGTCDPLYFRHGAGPSRRGSRPYGIFPQSVIIRADESPDFAG